MSTLSASELEAKGYGINALTGNATGPVDSNRYTRDPKTGYYTSA